MPPPRLRERDVLRAVIGYLAAQGFLVYRRNVGKFKLGAQWVQFNEPGMADLWGVERATGRHLEVEVKAPGEQPTHAQRLWLLGMERAKAIAFWCDSVERCAAELVARRGHGNMPGLQGPHHVCQNGHGQADAGQPGRDAALGDVSRGQAVQEDAP